MLQRMSAMMKCLLYTVKFQNIQNEQGEAMLSP